MKNFIALDTSGEYLTVIARKGEKTRIIFEENCAMQHSVRLMDAIEEAAGAVGLAPAECDFFCAAVGPGSFTGIRIGISAVKGLCAATGKPSLGVTTFAALAYNAEEKALAAIPAGRGDYYVCGFGEDKSIVYPPAVVGEDVLRELSKEYAVYAYAPLPVPHCRANPAAGLLSAAESAKAENFGPLAAFYLKKSQAEAELLKKTQGKTGDAPAKG